MATSKLLCLKETVWYCLINNLHEVFSVTFYARCKRNLLRWKEPTYFVIHKSWQSNIVFLVNVDKNSIKWMSLIGDTSFGEFGDVGSAVHNKRSPLCFKLLLSIYSLDQENWGCFTEIELVVLDRYNFIITTKVSIIDIRGSRIDLQSNTEFLNSSWWQSDHLHQLN